MQQQSDIWDRAAKCDCESRSHSNLQRRAALELLRWIAVASELPYLTPRELAAQMDIVEGIGDCLCGRRKHMEAGRQAVWTGVTG